MFRTISVIFFVLSVVLCSCGESAPAAEKAESKEIDPRLLYGQWRNVTLRLHMNTYKNSDSAFDMNVDEQNWEKMMGMRPIRTYYWSDHTYNSMHYDLHDSLVYNPAGRWYLVKDTIFMVDTFPAKGLVYKYRLKTDGKMAEFTGIEDMDGDGKADDEYFGTQRRFEMNIRR